MRPRAIAACLCVAAIALASAARADNPTPDDQSRAVALYAQSVDLYRAGDFTGALARLQEAYGLTHSAVLLYNIARSYEGLGDLQNAIDSYVGYLAQVPDAQDRGAIEQRVVTLRRQLADQEALRRDRERPAVPRVALPSETTARASAVPWVVAGLGAAGLTVGAILGAFAVKDHDDANNPSTSQVDAASKNENARSFATDANVILASGAVVMVAGVVWGLLDLRTVASPSTKESAGRLEPVLGVGGSVAYVGVRMVSF